MREWMRPSTIISLVALFVALSGTAVAVSDKVKRSQIAPRAVSAPKLAKGAVKPAKLETGAVRPRHLSEATVGALAVEATDDPTFPDAAEYRQVLGPFGHEPHQNDSDHAVFVSSARFTIVSEPGEAGVVYFEVSDDEENWIATDMLENSNFTTGNGVGGNVEIGGILQGFVPAGWSYRVRLDSEIGSPDFTVKYGYEPHFGVITPE